MDLQSGFSTGAVFEDSTIYQLDSQFLGTVPPRSQQETDLGTGRPGKRTGAGRQQPAVLLIEDDECARFAMAALLVREGYLVLTAATAHDAMGVLRVSPAGETLGLDLHEHGISAYPEYVISALAAPRGMGRDTIGYVPSEESVDLPYAGARK